MTTADHSQHANERRDSFRIDDDIHLEYRLLGDEAPQGANALRPRGESDFCHELMRLRELSLQSNHLLANLRKQHGDIAHYLSLLEKKIDLLTQVASRYGLGAEVSPTTHVNLSAGGLSFIQPEQLPAESRLQLKLVLFPAHICLQLTARVVYCVRQGNEGYRTGVEFVAPTEVERETLIRHLLEKQSRMLRRERGQSE